VPIYRNKEAQAGKKSVEVKKNTTRLKEERNGMNFETDNEIKTPEKTYKKRHIFKSFCYCFLSHFFCVFLLVHSVFLLERCGAAN
jgi:hypothetical protein